MALIADRSDLPVIIDADTGFGNALNAQRTMRQYERAGAAALQVEDQTYPKRCGHLADKALVPTAEMGGKIGAMVDARTRATRCSWPVPTPSPWRGSNRRWPRRGLPRRRCRRALRRGAATPRRDGRIGERFAGRVPLLANMVEGGATPTAPAAELQALGFAVAIFPGGIVRALARTAGTTTRASRERLQRAVRRPDVRLRRAQRGDRDARDARGRAARSGDG